MAHDNFCLVNKAKLIPAASNPEAPYASRGKPMKIKMNTKTLMLTAVTTLTLGIGAAMAWRGWLVRREHAGRCAYRLHHAGNPQLIPTSAVKTGPAFEFCRKLSQ
jgi:hypothetical protein